MARVEYTPLSELSEVSPVEASIDAAIAAGVAVHAGAHERTHEPERTDVSQTLPSPRAELAADEALAERDAEALRRDQAAQASALRKRTPLCTGLLDYAPDALDLVAHAAEDEFPEADASDLDLADIVLESLRYRDVDGRPDFANYRRMCLAALQILERALNVNASPVMHSPSLAAFMHFYARAFAAVAQVSWHGNQKHNPGQLLHHAREKSTDHEDCIARHLFDNLRDPGGFDGEFMHAAALVWRCFISLQIKLEHSGARRARGAR